jgi:hypothetical protein
LCVDPYVEHGLRHLRAEVAEVAEVVEQMGTTPSRTGQIASGISRDHAGDQPDFHGCTFGVGNCRARWRCDLGQQVYVALGNADAGHGW